MLFREAVAFTAAETRFTPRLVEKDYFSSVLLRHLAAAGAGLVFRGGTCLANVHARFYRLSEDLDFMLPTPVDASRVERSVRAGAAKHAVAAVAAAIPGLWAVSPFRGANDCRHYAATIGYGSLVGADAETIRIEAGLREPLLIDPVPGEARTLLLDPVSGEPSIPPLRLACVSLQEAPADGRERRVPGRRSRAGTRRARRPGGRARGSR